MISTRIKLAIAAKRLKSQPLKELDFGEAGALKKVGIILDSLDEKIGKSFEDMFCDSMPNGIIVETVYCLPHGKPQVLNNGMFFSIGELGWTGKINDSRISAFVGQEQDLLIRYTKGKNKLANYLVEASKATLKAGRAEGDTKDMDIVIATSFEEVEIFTGELKKYLGIINKSI